LPRLAATRRAAMTAVVPPTHSRPVSSSTARCQGFSACMDVTVPGGDTRREPRRGGVLTG